MFNPSRGREASFKRGMEMLLRAFSLNRRMHNKAWIVDGRLAVVAGATSATSTSVHPKAPISSMPTWR